MLFAAGFGTRMAPLTAGRPKPLIEVGGRALIDHAFAQIDGADVGKTVVNLHYLGPVIRCHLAGRSDVVFSEETPTLLDTGGGLRQALPKLGSGPVYTLNTDAVWTGDNALRQLVEAWNGTQMGGLLLLVPKDQALGHVGVGDFAMDADGRLTRGGDFVYTGAQIITTDLLTAIAESAFSLNRLWDLLLADGRLFGLVHNGGWCDVGRPDAIPLAETLLSGTSDV
ncbi:MAG: nucleotidyltransferase family protein [Albidovulum sp.]